jgi:hypothetical protein
MSTVNFGRVHMEQGKTFYNSKDFQVKLKGLLKNPKSECTPPLAGAVFFKIK